MNTSLNEYKRHFNTLTGHMQTVSLLHRYTDIDAHYYNDRCLCNSAYIDQEMKHWFHCYKQSTTTDLSKHGIDDYIDVLFIGEETSDDAEIIDMRDACIDNLKSCFYVGAIQELDALRDELLTLR